MVENTSMTYILTFTITVIVIFSRFHNLECSIIRQDDNVKQYFSLVPDPTIKEYKIAKLRQNTLNALRKLTQNWEGIPFRKGRQEEGLDQAQLEVVGASFKIANAVVHSIVSVISAVFRPTSNAKSQVKVKADATDEVPKNRTVEESSEISPIYDKENHLVEVTDSLRQKSYTDQLTGALNILADQDASNRIKREMINLSVDYITKRYIAANGKPQALFLPKLFEGI